jgi:hypothetical protein
VHILGLAGELPDARAELREAPFSRGHGERPGPETPLTRRRCSVQSAERTALNLLIPHTI